MSHHDHDETLLVMLHLPLTPATLPPQLTPAECHLVYLCARGLKAREMAAERGVEPCTISNQLSQLYRKLGVYDRHQMLAMLFGSLSQGVQG